MTLDSKPPSVEPLWTRADSAARRAKKRAAEGVFTDADIRALYKTQRGTCAYCGIGLGRKYHADHKTPLCRGGTNWPRDVHLVCKPCNLRKGRMTHEEYVMRMASLVGAG